MANTADTSMSNGIIQITYSGTGDDWLCEAETGFPKVKLRGILFRASGDGDILVVNDGGIDGPSIVNVKSGADQTDAPIYISFGEGMWCTPTIDLTDCTFGTIANVVIMLFVD